MALDKAALNNTIVTILTELLTREDTSIQEFADRFSDAVDVYVKSADIKYTSGLIAPSTGGAVTGTFEGNLE